MTPRFYDARQVEDRLPWPALIAAIEDGFADPNTSAPERTVHELAAPNDSSASLLLKPGWVVGDVIVVKVATYFPENGGRALPTVNAGVLMFSGVDGELLGACDGNVLTARRTAAASAVAAKRLVRPDARRLLVVGTGVLAPVVAAAHQTVCEFERIEIWGRDETKARSVAATLVSCGVPARAVGDLDAAVPEADVISCVTGATAPLLRGELLRPGTHVDLVGSFTESMRESDDVAVARATVFVDTYPGALVAGDLAQPITDGVIQVEDIAADLEALVTGTHPGRTSAGEITLFKSAGAAVEDVAAARLVFADPEGIPHDGSR